MIIVKLLVVGKELGSDVANCILKNKFTLNVFGSCFDSYHLNSSSEKLHSEVYVVQFVTKSMLYNEIDSILKKEFPNIDFYMIATPIVHMSINFHNKIRKRVTGLNLINEDLVD
ncbi:hypothetical protein ACQ33O_13235 [Ferruginibacter sp. SUN002]|uniref:hypothetical protein n=1 Tax=Ferruginibacter sp. SUN002 TaxID=2937789 RepID=UPI003D36C79E